MALDRRCDVTLVAEGAGLIFEWDGMKALSNQRKHGLTFEEALTAFGDPLSSTIDDPDHSNPEQRFILLGRTSTGKLVVVVHVERGDGRLRLISARAATKREREDYENG